MQLLRHSLAEKVAVQHSAQKSLNSGDGAHVAAFIVRTYKKENINSNWLLIVKEASDSKCSILYGNTINRG